MKIESAYPVICTDKIAESRDFYMQNFHFKITYEEDWYVSMRTKESPEYELALLNYQHPSLPDSSPRSGRDSSHGNARLTPAPRRNPRRVKPV